MEKKVKYIFFDSRKTAFELVVLNTRFYWERILLIGCQYVNKQSLDFIYCLDRIFEAVFLSDWSKNMTKILSCSFKNWFGPFNMLIFSKCSDTWLSRHFSNRAFAAYSLTKKSPLRLILFLKVFTIWCSFQKRRKKSRKYCSISRKLILNWLRKTVAFTKTEHLWSGVNTLTKSLKISDTAKTEFLELIFSQSD